jgi:hypothetical protein
VTAANVFHLERGDRHATQRHPCSGDRSHHRLTAAGSGSPARAVPPTGECRCAGRAAAASCSCSADGATLRQPGNCGRPALTRVTGSRRWTTLCSPAINASKPRGGQELHLVEEEDHTGVAPGPRNHRRTINSGRRHRRAVIVRNPAPHTLPTVVLRGRIPVRSQWGPGS